MFSAGHILFIGISAVVIAAGLWYCNKKRPPIRDVMKVCFALGLVSELIKVFDKILIVPVVKPIVENGVLIYLETGQFAPYLEAEHLPFELCSYQLFFMFFALVLTNEKHLKRLHALMYTTCIIGASIALILASVANDYDTVAEFLGSYSCWRFFLYHAMLVILGVYIGMSNECDIHFKNIKSTTAIIVALDFVTLYLNSMMSTPVYSGDDLMGVGNSINYFSSYNNPLGIVMPGKKEWMIYLCIRIVLGLICILLVNVPLLLKDRKEGKQNG